jgi:hypothetical protein
MTCIGWSLISFFPLFRFRVGDLLMQVFEYVALRVVTLPFDQPFPCLWEILKLDVQVHQIGVRFGNVVFFLDGFLVRMLALFNFSPFAIYCAKIVPCEAVERVFGNYLQVELFGRGIIPRALQVNRRVIDRVGRVHDRLSRHLTVFHGIPFFDIGIFNGRIEFPGALVILPGVFNIAEVIRSDREVVLNDGAAGLDIGKLEIPLQRILPKLQPERGVPGKTAEIRAIFSLGPWDQQLRSRQRVPVLFQVII